MLISEILSRVRSDLSDTREIQYADGLLLSRIREELNDTAGENSANIDVLSSVRKILSDESSRTGTPVSLASIRAELNDTANVTAFSTADIAKSVRAKLGDVDDVVLGTTTAANVTPESVIHYAQWGNAGNVTGTTGNINASVTLASSTNLFGVYVADGIKTIIGMRPDATINGVLSGGFQTALNLYVLARCLEGEVEANGGGGFGAFYDRFVQAVNSVPAHVSDSVLAHAVSMGTAVINGRRPDLGVCGSTSTLLEDFVMGQFSQSKLGDNGKVQLNLQNFYSELDKIPYHYADAELNGYIADGQAAVKAIRPDAVSIIDCFSDAVKSYAVCHAMGRRFGKNAEGMSVWQANDANFKAVVAAVPYHWTDAELRSFMDMGESAIAIRRPDLSGTSAGKMDQMHYTVFSALERRIGKDENAAALHKVHLEQFYADMDHYPKHYSDSELEAFQEEGKSILSALREDAVSNGMIRSDLVPALLFCTVAMAENYAKDASTRSLNDSQWSRLLGLLKAIPFHWTNETLLMFLHDSIRDILRLRSDARMDDFGYELAGVTDTPLQEDPFPLRESFAKASEYFCAAQAVSSRIGQDPGAEGKYQIWRTNYETEITGGRKR
ncbi:MAG: hypothetical protein J6A21_03055 [Lentisphaeria bacterium]|nr:hypothetical protein [Lentisphaeria bacterium]